MKFWHFSRKNLAPLVYRLTRRIDKDLSTVNVRSFFGHFWSKSRYQVLSERRVDSFLLFLIVIMQISLTVISAYVV